MNHMHLSGADQVERAGYAMVKAAERMQFAAASIDQALRQHQQFLDDWLQRLEQVLAEYKT